jgi:hypothetical protein
MKTFQTRADQGEIRINKIEALPAGLVPLEPENGRYIIGHSETGHFHTMTLDLKQVFRDPNPPAGMTILYAILQEPSCLDHERPFDTHESIQVPAGIVRFTTSREFDHYAALARKAAD